MLTNLYTLDAHTAWQYGINYRAARIAGGDPTAIARSYTRALAFDTLDESIDRLTEMFLIGVLGIPWDAIEEVSE